MWPFGKAKASGEKVVIFFASDLHGSTVCFRKFINAAKFYKANILVMGGDMTGKAIMPVAKQSDGSHLVHDAGRESRLTSSAEVAEFCKRAENSGFYPVIVSEEEFRSLASDEKARHGLFKRLVCERVSAWCDYAMEKLNGTGVVLVTAPGNDDFFEIDDILTACPAVHFHEMEVTEIMGYEMLHVGGSTKTPWDTEREFTEDEYQDKFRTLVPKVKDISRCIFNVHVPPFGTILDACPKLDENLQVVFEMGNPVSMHAGSSALTEVIKESQPLLGIHGHIHEGRGNIRIGRTVCINPGSVYPEGILQGALITLQGTEVTGVHLTQG